MKEEILPPATFGVSPKVAGGAWHNLEWEEVVKKFGSNVETGLTEKEVKIRRRKFGANELPAEKPFSKTRIFLEQIRSPLVYILIVAGIVTFLFKEYTDCMVIFGAVFLNTIVGYFQENKASNALRQLKKIVRHSARVVRDGGESIKDSSDLVIGDIFILNPGDRVPADGRLIEVHNLKINEMCLTGEWLPATKRLDILPEKTSLADRDNMVYMGSIVEDGKAAAIAVGTGIQTEIGRVAEMVKETKEEKTSLQKKLARFSKIIGMIIAVVCVGIFIEGVITGVEVIEMFTIAVAVAVAAIPEGLPVAMTVILALGMTRILKRKGLVRKLVAAETLGSTSIICTDKTATLTQGKMRVSEIFTPGQIFNKKDMDKGSASLTMALKIAALCNEAFIENPEAMMEKWIIRGRPTDKALLSASIEAGINKKELEQQLFEIDEVPFDSIHKYIAKLYQTKNDSRVLYVCGAPEKILGLSDYFEIDNKIEELSVGKLKQMELKLDDLTGKGMRVVAVGYKEAKSEKRKAKRLEEEVKNLVFAGFIALKDPLRKEVKGAIKICQQAGMKPIIVTGDHKLTARAVAEELGLKIKEEHILEGEELDQFSDEEFDRRVKDIQIYARVEPKHKMRIISAWQRRGEVVAMTGDGINDAPALKKADIGVALGSGSEVAKEVSDLILLPDSFDIIVAAIEEGRAIIDNIRKVITYLLSDSFTEVILIGVSLMLGLPLPIVAVQVLWVNLIEDGPLGLCLAFEPKEKDLMRRKPESSDIPLLTKEMKALIFIIGLITDILLLALFFWLLRYSNYEIPHIQSIIFAGLTIDSLFYVFSCKSLRRNLWHINPFSNKFLILAWALGIIALLAALYVPVLQTLLKTVPLSLFDWQLVLGLGLLNILLIEATKWYFITKLPLTLSPEGERVRG